MDIFSDFKEREESISKATDAAINDFRELRAQGKCPNTKTYPGPDGGVIIVKEIKSLFTKKVEAEYRPSPEKINHFQKKENQHFDDLFNNLNEMFDSFGYDLGRDFKVKTKNRKKKRN